MRVPIEEAVLAGKLGVVIMDAQVGYQRDLYSSQDVTLFESAISANVALATWARANKVCKLCVRHHTEGRVVPSLSRLFSSRERFSKSHPSPFSNIKFGEKLERAKVKTLILGGFFSEECLAWAAKDGLERGMNVILPSDNHLKGYEPPAFVISVSLDDLDAPLRRIKLSSVDNKTLRCVSAKTGKLEEFTTDAFYPVGPTAEFLAHLTPILRKARRPEDPSLVT